MVPCATMLYSNAVLEVIVYVNLSTCSLMPASVHLCHSLTPLKITVLSKTYFRFLFVDTFPTRDQRSTALQYTHITTTVQMFILHLFPLRFKVQYLTSDTINLQYRIFYKMQFVKSSRQFISHNYLTTN